jgi:hypothetical protein
VGGRVRVSHVSIHYGCPFIPRTTLVPALPHLLNSRPHKLGKGRDAPVLKVDNVRDLGDERAFELDKLDTDCETTRVPPNLTVRVYIEAFSAASSSPPPSSIRC